VVPPMLKQAGGFRGDLPVVQILKATPLVHISAQLIDDRGWIVLLLLGRETFAFVKDHLDLLSRSLALSGLWNGRDELGAAPLLDDLLGRLPFFIKLPAAKGVLVRGIEDWFLKEAICHCYLSSRYGLQLRR
jgi:hypothetical protein